MKTPWKIIGRLFSSGRTSESADSRDEASDEVSTSTMDVNAVAEPVQLGTEAPAGEAEDEPRTPARLMAEAAKESSEHTPVASEHAGQKVQGAHRKGRATPPSKASVAGEASHALTQSASPRKATKAKRTAVKRSHLRGAPAPRNEGPPQVKQQASFDEETANLDAEIRVLSRQLSAKLRQQNAQLRKMLERFGPI